MGIQNLTGQTFGQYELRELLGAGGMGAVYRGYQANLRRYVAVKVLSNELADQPGYLERFNREAQTSAALEHPHIITVHDYGMQQGVSYLVMQLLSGGSLTERLKQRADSTNPLPSLGEVAELLKQVGSALDYAHSEGVIHRDIKPSNVMFDNHGNAYLVDFGIAKLVQATQALTASGTVIGTWPYMAPEQWRNEELVAATDQYALGVMTYQLVSGQLPFEAPTPAGVMYKHLNEMPTPPHAHRPGLPQALTLVIERALAKRSQDRFVSCTAFAQAFAGAIESSTGPNTHFFVGSLKRKPTPATSTVSEVYATPGSGAQATGRPIHRHPAMWVMAALLVTTIAVIAFLLLGTGDDGGKETPPTATQVAAVVEDSPTAITALTTTTETPSLTDTPTVDIAAVVQATVEAGMTQTATQWTPTPQTPTVDYVGTIDAQMTALHVLDMTGTAFQWTATPSLTSTSTVTPTETHTHEPTQTAVPTTTPTVTWAPTASTSPTIDAVQTALTDQATRQAQRPEALTIAWVPKWAGFEELEVFVLAREGCQTAAAELTQTTGIDVECRYVLSDEFNAESQAAAVDAAIAEGADAVAISCFDAAACIEPIQRWASAGIPVITWDDGLPDFATVTHYGINNYEAGIAAANVLLWEMGTEGKVAVVTGNLGDRITDERVRGFAAGVADTDIEIVGVVESHYDIDTSVRVIEDTMREYPDLDGWFFAAMWPVYADQGAMPLYEDAVRNDGMKVVAFDITREELVWMQAGLLHGLVGQRYWHWGYDPVHMLYDHIVNGKTFDMWVDAEMQIVTAHNLDAILEMWDTHDFTKPLPAPYSSEYGEFPYGTIAPDSVPRVEAPSVDKPTSDPLELALNFSGSNNDWSPVIQEFDGVEMVLVPAGCFMMGSEKGVENERPVHEVCFEEPFWIDQTEVTNEQFAAFNGQAVHDSQFSGDTRPRESISWVEAQAFCVNRDGRLPTEAEWEYAARGPDGLLYPWGNNWWGPYTAWSGNSNGATMNVGSKPEGASWVGALDMSGNVWEWVADWYGTYPIGRAVDPTGRFSGGSRVLRGGSWSHADIDVFRTSYRLGYPPKYNYGYIGFRCARDANLDTSDFSSGESETGAVATSAGTVFYAEDFEDGEADGFTMSSVGWSVIDDGTGNQVYQGGSGTGWILTRVGSTDWDNYRVEFRMKAITVGPSELDANITVRSVWDTSEYGLSISVARNAASLYLGVPTTDSRGVSWEYRLIAGTSTDLDLRSGEWIDVTIEVTGDQISASMDGVPFWGTDDTYVNGNVVFGVGPEAVVQFDDIRITATSP